LNIGANALLITRYAPTHSFQKSTAVFTAQETNTQISKNYIMKTIKTILMIALFSLVTISCTDLTAEDELMLNPPVEMTTGSDSNDSDTPPTDDGSGTEDDVDDSGEGNTGEDGTGKGN